MSRHPYYILQDLLEHARDFCEVERELLEAVPPGSPFPFQYPLHQIEASLARSGGRCLHFWGEYGERIAQMEDKPFGFHESRLIDEIAETIRDRVVSWGWRYLLFRSGMDEVDLRLKAHHENKTLPLLDAALSWRSARKVTRHLGADALADQAMRLRVKSTMTPEEGERVIWDLHRAWFMCPALGESVPTVSSEDHENLERAIGEVWTYHRNLIPPESPVDESTDAAQERQDSSRADSRVWYVPEDDLRDETSSQPGQSTNRVLALDSDGRIICIHLGGAKVHGGIWSGRNDPYAYRFNLLFTKCRRWVRGHQQLDSGYVPAPHVRSKAVAFEVLTDEQAVAWCTQNYHPHPPELLDAFDPSLRLESETAQRGDPVAKSVGGLAEAQQNIPVTDAYRRQTSGGAGSAVPSRSDIESEVRGERDCGRPDDEIGGSEGRERRVREHLEQHPKATSEDIHRAIGIPHQTVRKLKAWKERPAAASRKEETHGPSRRIVQLTHEMLALRPGDDDDPAQIVVAKELLEREYLEQATPEDKAEYYSMEPDERTNALWLFGQSRDGSGE
jgi:hypothetical protein